MGRGCQAGGNIARGYELLTGRKQFLPIRPECKTGTAKEEENGTNPIEPRSSENDTD